MCYFGLEKIGKLLVWQQQWRTAGRRRRCGKWKWRERVSCEWRWERSRLSGSAWWTARRRSSAPSFLPKSGSPSLPATNSPYTSVVLFFVISRSEFCTHWVCWATGFQLVRSYYRTGRSDRDWLHCRWGKFDWFVDLFPSRQETRCVWCVLCVN